MGATPLCRKQSPPHRLFSNGGRRETLSGLHLLGRKKSRASSPSWPRQEKPPKPPILQHNDSFSSATAWSKPIPRVVRPARAKLDRCFRRERRCGKARPQLLLR